jgi:hypothetical protein
MLLLSLAMTFGAGAASDVVITGTVTFRDTADPVKGAQIVVTELRWRPLAMPRPVELAAIKTDDEGRFVAKLTRVRGSLDVGLVSVPCERTGDARAISKEDLRGSSHFHVNLLVARSKCTSSLRRVVDAPEAQ